jgi:hypothetical protein
VQTAVDLRGLGSLQVEELTADLPGGPPVGTIVIIARRSLETVTISLPRDVALSLHQALDPWARAVTEETDHGPKPSAN